MAETKILQGILALVDIVNFAGQSIKAGETATAAFTAYFHEKVKNIAEKQGFRVVQAQDDAVLMLGSDLVGFLEIFKDLSARDPLVDKHGFSTHKRLVAHSGFFQFQMDNNRPVELVNADGFRFFRAEVNALTWQWVVTHALFVGIKPFLTQNHIKAVRLEQNEPISGFDNEEWFPPFYLLQLENIDTGVSNLLEQRMEELKRDSRYIPVFGNVYAPVPMGNSFINLMLRPNKNLHLYAGPDKSQEPDIDIASFYEKQRQGGIVFGLPGAGKTTLLRYMVFREFQDNESKLPGQKQTVITISCQHAPFYDLWFEKRFNAQPGAPSLENALSYMTWVFLFGKKQRKELTNEEELEFQNAEKTVYQSYRDNRLTLLVDALDEAQDTETRARLAQLFFLLPTGNRLVLTTRPSESFYLQEGMAKNPLAAFDLLPLSLWQVRSLARHIFSGDTLAIKTFDQAIQQEYQITGTIVTPIMALLFASYFQAYGKFDCRFQMYETVLKFILLKAWDSMKSHSFPFKNLALFFDDLKKADFFERYREIKVIYDALAYLCYHLLYDQAHGKNPAVVNHETLMLLFIRFINENWPGVEESTAPQRAELWCERLQKDHLLILNRQREYEFFHPSVREYWAAYYLVNLRRRQDKQFVSFLLNCLSHEALLALETIPIACGSDMMTGFKILGILRDHSHTSPRQDILDFAVKCLAELELLIEKTLQSIRIQSLKVPFQNMIQQNQESTDWVYLYLQEQLLTADTEQLNRALKYYPQQLKLSRSTFLDGYVKATVFFAADSETVAARKQWLRKWMLYPIVEQWEVKHTMLGNSNPYIYSSVMPIDSDMFFGREKEILRLVEMVSPHNPQSVSIVGERRIGKSSLVWRVYHQIKQEAHTRAIYLDCSQIAPNCHTKDQFFLLLNQQFCEGEITPPAGDLFTDYISFKGFVRAAGRQGLKTLLFMDEFEHLPENTFADDTFFSNLRALANSPDNRLAFVTVSKTALKELTHKAVKSSGFWNIFDTHYIGLLDHPSIMALRNCGLEKTGVAFSREEMDKIAYYAGDFPYFNQMACGFVWESKRDQTAVAWERLETKLRPHYQEIWNHRIVEEQRLLKNLNFKEELSLNDLLARGILIQVGEVYYHFSVYFSELITKVLDEKEKRFSWEKFKKFLKEVVGIFRKGKEVSEGDI